MAEKKSQGTMKGASMLLGSAITALGGLVAYNKLMVNHEQQLPLAFNADRQTFASKTSGLLSYYEDNGDGAVLTNTRPIVLVHSVNAGASAYEMRPIFEHFRGKRPVYALELPGFGFSERADREYTSLVFSQAITDMLETRLDEPADVVALSLSCEFAARSAYERPDLFHSLTMISPSGLSASPHRQSNLMYKVLSVPLWEKAFFDVLTTRAGIRYFLKKSFVGDVDEGMVDYAIATTNQPGAHYAPLYFVSGLLFMPHIRETVYEKLEIPVLVLYDEDAFVSFEDLPIVLERNPNWHAERISPTRGLPHFDEPEQTMNALTDFWSDTPKKYKRTKRVPISTPEPERSTE